MLCLKTDVYFKPGYILSKKCNALYTGMLITDGCLRTPVACYYRSTYNIPMGYHSFNAVTQRYLS